MYLSFCQEDQGDRFDSSRRSKTLIRSENADDAGSVTVEDDDTDTEAEMLEILTDAEEV